MPSLFAASYCHLEPELAVVLDDGSGRAAGYVLGTANTDQFVKNFRAARIPRVATRRPPERHAQPARR